MIIQGYSDSGLASLFATQNATSGVNVSTSASRSGASGSVAATFAQDIVSRISTTAQTTAQTTTQTSTQPSGTDSAASDAATRDTSELESSLAEAVDYVRSEFGDTAATAVMALVYKSVGDGPVTEENLGNGLLNALKLVDRQLGVAAGDKLMAHFNTGVNAALNDYFDNGLNEIFYAASSSGQNPAVQALSVAENSLGSTLNSSLDEDAVVSVLDILRQSLEEAGYGPEGLRQGLDNANRWLAENRPDASALALEDLLPGATPSMPSGTLLDVQV